MKTIKLCVAVVGFTFTTLIGRSQTYSIPWALQQPSWVFPLWFEDGSGAKDTIFFCYEPNTSISPILLGAIDQNVSPDTFNVTFAIGDYSDTIAEKVELNQLEEGVWIFCRHFMFPLTIRWDVSLMRSDSLPFPDQDPSPRAQGLLSYDLPMLSLGCPFDYPAVITDSVTFPIMTCYISDSILFTGTGAAPLTFRVVPWTGTYLGTVDPDESRINIFPNPASDLVNLKGLPVPSNVRLINSIGQTVVLFEVLNPSTKMPTSGLPAGIYALTVSNGDKLITKTVSIIH